MNKIIGFSLALCLFSTSWAAASGPGVLLGFGLNRFQQEVEGPTLGTSKSTSTYYDVKLGYKFGSDFYLGGIYSTYSEDNGVIEPKQSMYGVTIGYHHNGWFFDASYFLDGQYDLGSVVFKKASGLGIDFGYQYMVNSNLYVGAQYTSKSYSYKEYEVTGVIAKEDNKIKSQSQPMFLFGFIF
jgi:hypothetical protein